MSIGIGLGIPKKYGKANEYYLEFDGSDDNILIGNKLDFNYDAKRTFAFRFRLSQTDGRVIISKTEWTPASKGFQLFFNSGKLSLRYYESGSSTGIKAVSDNTYNDNNWHYGVVQYNGGVSPSVEMYVDDMTTPISITSSGSGFSGADTTNTRDMYIGVASYANYYWLGDLDRISISSGLLTESQRNNIFTKVSGLAYWDFNEGHGTTAKDKTGNGNDGTLLGGATLPEWRKW